MMTGMVAVTMGQLCFYGGIAGAGASFFFMIMVFIVAEGKKKKMLKNIEQED